MPRSSVLMAKPQIDNRAVNHILARIMKRSSISGRGLMLIESLNHCRHRCRETRTIRSISMYQQIAKRCTATFTSWLLMTINLGLWKEMSETKTWVFGFRGYIELCPFRLTYLSEKFRRWGGKILVTFQSTSRGISGTGNDGDFVCSRHSVVKIHVFFNGLGGDTRISNLLVHDA